jgi:hypothetical protein
MVEYNENDTLPNYHKSPLPCLFPVDLQLPLQSSRNLTSLRAKGVVKSRTKKKN